MQASGPDAAILSAWANYLAGRDTLDALPDDKESVDEQAAFEAPYWAECDKAEMTILETEATTPAGIAVKIKIALAHMLTQRTHDNALRNGDLATLADPELDWDRRVLVSALRSLEGMGGVIVATAPADRAPGVVIRPAAFPPAASARIAGKLLNWHSAHEIAEAITVLIDVLDLMGGDPDAEESDPPEANGDERDMSWPDRIGQHRIGAPIGTEDDEPDDFGEIDDAL